jgi:hypothetical protein
MNALEALESWEESLSAYEKIFQTKVDADAKMGALLQMLPEVLREHLYMNADRYSNYDAMRAAAVLYLEEKQDRNGTADENVPMEVETRLLALEKGKGKGKKGKSYKDGKGKDGKGKGKAKDGKGKGKESKDGKAPVKFEGYCNGCWKWGHRLADCWAKPKQLTVLEGAENEVGEDPTGQLTVLERHEDTGPAMPWLLALTAAEEGNAVLAMENSSTTGRRERVLLDCCSAGSLCPPRLESKAIRPSKASTYKSATGGVLHTRGRQMTTMRTVLDNALVAHDFEVARQDYQPNVLIMSAGNLTSTGYRIVLDDEGSYIENKESGQRLVVEKRNNIYEFLTEIVENTAKIPCDNEAIVLPLSADEPALDAALGPEEHTAKA